jgi:hypothetical protein
MADYIRLSELTFPNDEDCTAPVWSAVEGAVIQQFNIQPFGEIKDVAHPSFKYVQSSKHKDRFEVLAHHQRFKSTVEVVENRDRPEALGPIEVDVLRFMNLSYPHLGLLIGGMGGGKSTTVRYLLKNHLSDTTVVYCDLDPNPKIAVESPEWAAKLLSEYVSPQVQRLVLPAEEFTRAWTWGMSNSDENPHHAKSVLSGAITRLRRELEDKWIEESSEAITIRKQCHEAICKDHQEFLTYLAFLIDYYLSVKCSNDRGRFLLVLDNIDPLPPTLQYELLRCASRLQESAQCKVLVAMRPMTYSRNLQVANRTAEFIEHLGPDALDLIQTRVESLVFKANLSQIRVKMKDENGDDLEVGEPEIKYWINQVLMSAKQTGVSHSGEHGAREFIEGVCNNSLRSALVLAPQLFTSAVVPFVLAGTPPHRSDQSPRIRSHELVRALMTGRRSCFRAVHAPIVDSVFDLGKDASYVSLLCKVRLLKKLDVSGTGVLALEQLREHLLIFGIPDQAILEGVNSIIAQTKRLAWSDSVVEYKSFAEAPASKIKIADAGRFYVRTAIINLEYVQEAHVDAPLPPSAVLRGYQNTKFADRVTSLHLFIRHLHDVDRREVLRGLAMHRGQEYLDIYGAELVSACMAKALARQVLSVGRAMLAGKVGQRFMVEVEQALRPWREMENFFDYEDRDILSKLKELQAGAA